MSDIANGVLSPKKANWLLGLILGIAAILRSIVGYHRWANDESVNSFHLLLARRIALGEGFYFTDYPVDGFIWYAQRPPGYAMVLAGLLSVLPDSKHVFILFSSILGALVVFLTYYLGQKLYNQNAGLLAAAICAVYPYYVVNDQALNDRLLFTALLMISLLGWINYYIRPSFKTAAIFGFLLALSTLVRGTGVLVLPILMVLSLYTMRKFGVAHIIKTGLFASAIFALGISPWIIRNYYVIGEPVFSTVGGHIMWVGNNPYNTKVGYPFASAESGFFYYVQAMSNEEKHELLQVGELGVSDFFKEKVWEYVKKEPLDVVRHTVVKPLVFWSPVFFPFYFCEFPNGVSDGAVVVKKYESYYKMISHFFSYGLVLLVFLIYCKQSRFEGDHFVFVLALILTVVHTMTVAQSVYRTPLDAFLIIMASGAFVGAYAKNLETKSG